MEFGPVPVQSAQGAILAHSLRVDGHTFRKGRVLSADDVSALATAGYRDVTVARLDIGDVAEDEAAHRIAAALAGENLRVGAAFTGRANLYAEMPGLALVDTECIAALNGIDEAITVATLAPFSPVVPRQMVATIKIIPFAAPAHAVAQGERLAEGKRVIRVAAFQPRQAALITTSLAGTRPAVIAKTRSTIAARLEALGSRMVFDRDVPHRTEALTQAIAEAHSAGADPLLIFGASAITDRRDVVPAAIEAAGGRVEHFGMPVDPGNLLLLGRIGGTTVVGLPGCARSPKLNGADFVLQRLLADVPVRGHDIAAMGVGGLLTEIPGRPQPRDRPVPASASRAPRIAAVILAAGSSTRMGRNKLLAEIGGRPMLRYIVEIALASSGGPVIVVTGNEASRAEQALAGLPVTIANNPAFRNGLSGSLITGINAVPEDCDGALILLGDMPDVTARLIDRLIAAFDPAEGRAICVATRNHRRGNPVLWSREFFPEIRSLRGDVGAKALIGANEERVCEIEASDDGPLLDLDTPEALAAYIAARP